MDPAAPIGRNHADKLAGTQPNGFIVQVDNRADVIGDNSKHLTHTQEMPPLRPREDTVLFRHALEGEVGPAADEAESAARMRVQGEGLAATVDDGPAVVCADDGDQDGGCTVFFTT